MSYSSRQQHCLEAMGIVPWVARYSAQQLPAEGVPDSLSENAPLQTQVSNAIATESVSGSTMEIPSDLQELGRWLPQQRLADFGYKGSVHTVLGHPEAPLLVIAEQPENRDGELPLSGDAEKLFELMMRSIDLGRSAIRQCALDDGTVPSPSHSGETPTVGEACTAHTRAALILMQSDVGSEIAADAHHCRLAESQLPLWRIVHPEILLRDNQRKRQAWQSLKALQHYLAAGISQ